MQPSNKSDWENDPELIELTNFLIEKTKDAKSSMNLKQLAGEFKETSGASQEIPCLLFRIYSFRLKIHRMDSIDKAAKVKMLVALGGSVDKDFLKKLRKDAVVEVDKKNRITKYVANDGSLELTADHSHSAKIRDNWKQKKMENKISQGDSDDESMNSIPKTPGSTKRVAAAEVSSSSKRTKTGLVKSEDHAPDDTARSSESRAREVLRRFSPQPPTPRIQQCREPKLEEATGGVPKTSGAHIPRAIPIKTEPGADDAQTPQIKFLKTIQSVILNLDMPSLSPLQTKIEQKLLESSNENIPNEEMIMAMEMLIAKIAHRSVSNINEIVESVNLKEFLCYLKPVISNSKLEDVGVLLEKIKERIREPASKDKSIPVDKFITVLHNTLDGI